MFEENFVSYHFSRLLSPKGTSATSVQAPVVAFTVFSLPRAWLEPRNTGRVNANVATKVFAGPSIERSPRTSRSSFASEENHFLRGLKTHGSHYRSPTEVHLLFPQESTDLRSRKLK